MANETEEERSRRIRVGSLIMVALDDKIVALKKQLDLSQEEKFKEFWRKCIADYEEVYSDFCKGVVKAIKQDQG